MAIKNHEISGSIVSEFEKIAELYPHHTALKLRGASMTYGELNRKANRFARFLQEKGVRPHDIVSFSLEKNMDLYIALLAILKAGAVYLPIDEAYPEERKQFMMEDAKPKFHLAAPDFEKRMPADDTNLEIVIKPSDLAYINYTSGSTGRPKGVEICHQGVIRLVKNTHWMPISTESRCLQLATISFDASTHEIWGALLNGASLYPYPQKEFSIEVLEKLMTEEKITHFDCTPRVFNLIVDTRIELFKSVEFLTIGGDVLSPHHAAALHSTFPRCKLLNTYGPTENTCLTTTYEITDLKAIVNGVPIGRPIDHTTVYILDEHLQPVPDGSIGELCTGGEGVARGYMNRPDLTQEKFIPNPFGPGRLYRTGDLARYLPDGNIEFLGRIDKQIKLRGFRIEPGEIENTLRSHQGADDCVVELKQETLVAYVLAKPGILLTSESIQQYSKNKLPDYMQPAIFHIVNELPLTPNGKVDRGALPDPKDLLENRSFKSPETETEKKLAPIWAQFFGLSKVGRSDDFFHIGGDSIDAVEMALMASNAFGISVPVGWLFTHSSLEKYAKRLEEKEVDAEAPFTAWRDEEAKLDPKIQAPSTPLEIDQYENPKKIFLTGATGFVGAFFLRELLETTEASVYCLVRTNSLKKVLEGYKIWKPEYQSRIVHVIGDLEKSRFGLTPDLFAQLSEEIDSIFHIGAYVNHALPYHKLKAANVLGTEEVIRLASSKRLKPLHHISTVDVLEPKESRPLTEDIDIDTCHNLPTGYAQSKWVAEKLVMEARRRGLPANIYRLSRVCGDSEIGSGSTTDFLWRTLQACVKLKKAPKMAYKEEMTPVDYICNAIRHISAQEDLIGHQYHVLNNQLYSYEELFRQLKQLGYTSQIVDFQEWKDTLEHQAIVTKEAGLRALMTMFPATDGEATSFKNCRLKQALKNTSIFCPQVCKNLFKKYVDYYVSIGFIEAV